MYNHRTLSNSDFQKCESIIANNPFKNMNTWKQVLNHLKISNEVFFKYLAYSDAS